MAAHLPHHLPRQIQDEASARRPRRRQVDHVRTAISVISCTAVFCVLIVGILFAVDYYNKREEPAPMEEGIDDCKKAAIETRSADGELDKPAQKSSIYRGEIKTAPSRYVTGPGNRKPEAGCVFLRPPGHLANSQEFEHGTKPRSIRAGTHLVSTTSYYQTLRRKPLAARG